MSIFSELRLSFVLNYVGWRRALSDFMFKLNKNILQYSEGYKYLGVIFHEKMNFHKNADTVSNAEAGGQALGTML